MPARAEAHTPARRPEVTDPQTFAALVIQARVAASSGVHFKARCLIPESDCTGTSRLEIQTRMRRFWKHEWSFERVTACVQGLVDAGAVAKLANGFRVVSWERLGAVAAGAQ